MGNIDKDGHKQLPSWIDSWTSCWIWRSRLQDLGQFIQLNRNGFNRIKEQQNGGVILKRQWQLKRSGSILCFFKSFSMVFKLSKASDVGSSILTENKADLAPVAASWNILATP